MPKKYKLFETDQFQKDLNRIKGKIREKFYNKITKYIYPQLKTNPYFGKNIKKLRNWKPETWRYRIGDYRLFYEIDEIEKVIFLITLEQRKNVY